MNCFRKLGYLIVASLVEAGPAIEAGIGRTVVTIHEAIATLEAPPARARVAALVVDARGAVPAGHRGGTLVDVQLATCALESEGAGARELLVVSVGRARAAVLAGRRPAGVQLALARLAGVGRHTGTLEVVYLVDADALVPARLVDAVVDVQLEEEKRMRKIKIKIKNMKNLNIIKP